MPEGGYPPRTSNSSIMLCLPLSLVEVAWLIALAGLAAPSSLPHRPSSAVARPLPLPVEVRLRAGHPHPLHEHGAEMRISDSGKYPKFGFRPRTRQSEVEKLPVESDPGFGGRDCPGRGWNRAEGRPLVIAGGISGRSEVSAARARASGNRKISLALPIARLPAVGEVGFGVGRFRVVAVWGWSFGVGSSGAMFSEWSCFALRWNAWQGHASLFQWVSRSRATHAIGRHSGATFSSMISRGSAHLPTKPLETAFSCVCARGSGCACARVRTHTRVYEYEYE